jgi:transposase
LACSAAHVATLADAAGRLVWSNHRFRTATVELERLWARVPAGPRLQLVIEPTRNAWVPLAAWFRARGVTVILVPPEQSAGACQGVCVNRLLILWLVAGFLRCG